MKNQNTMVSNKMSDIPPCPESDKFKPKPCLDCGEMVEPSYWKGRKPVVFSSGYKSLGEPGRWRETSERCLACEVRHKHQKEKEENVRRILENCGLTKRNWSMDFGNFKTKTRNQERALKLLKEYDCSHPRNVFIYGPVGTGKTHLAVGLAKQFVDQAVRGLKFVTGVNLLYGIRATFSTDIAGETDDLISKFSGVSFLVLDDIGAEKPTEWVRETFYMIVDNRYSEMLPTVVTSNLNPKDLADRLDDRLVSRLLDNAIVIKLEGTDYRITGGK